MSDWRERMSRLEAERENQRAARFRLLDETLQEALDLDADVLSGDDRAALLAARSVILDLRRTW